jgi:hypothetical protein
MKYYLYSYDEKWYLVDDESESQVLAEPTDPKIPRYERWTCAVCGERSITDYYMVHDALWKESGIPAKGMAHIKCLSTKIGRPLTEDDFTEVPVNHLLRVGVDLERQRLLTSIDSLIDGVLQRPKMYTMEPGNFLVHLLSLRADILKVADPLPEMQRYIYKSGHVTVVMPPWDADYYRGLVTHIRSLQGEGNGSPNH